VLSATRTGEAVGARWNEFDMKEKLWTIPAWRVKGGEDHIVPLTGEMLALLATVPRKDGEDRLFPDCGATDTLKLLQKLPGRAGYTVHGFRSSFRDWCGNETAFARDVVEETYGHAIGNDVERAYRRQKALKKRRQVIEAWNGYVCGGVLSGKPMQAAA
jgi:integrase